MQNTDQIQSVDKQKKFGKISKILVTQAKPTDENSPYHALANKYNLTVDFKPFIEIESVPYKEFRKQKLEISEFTAIIFTSRNAVDHFFKICKEGKVELAPTTKYFCVSDQTANYLQKYIVLRKRKIFVGQKTAADLFEIMKKHKNEKFLYPCSDIRNDDIPDFLKKNEFDYKEAIIYNTVPSNLSDIKNIYQYDILVFFSPSGVNSLLHNFPDFEQKNIRIAAFGNTTGKAVKDMGLLVDIEAPMPNAPSMTGALELYIKENNS
ncbi:MAG: uroporphyrinogen-III synthase [Bacteroidota bacterium]|nr:uroporphyrinogen-III synthase [Bacteroidota bacterium]